MIQTVDSVEDCQVVLYVITCKTKDFGDKYVVRRHGIERGEQLVEKDPVAVVDTLEGARERIPAHMFRLPKDPNDDPVVVESYI